MQPQIASQIPPQAWGLAIKTIVNMMAPSKTARIQAIVKERTPSVEEYLGIPSTKESCLAAVKKQDPKIIALHSAVCRCTASILWDKEVNPAIRETINPMRPQLLETLKLVICIQQSGPFDETCPIIQIVAMQAIDEVLKQNKMRK